MTVHAAAPLSATPSAPALEYDVALLDLDGVVYVGADAVPGAAGALAAAREQGMRLAFVTNNAARPPQAVAAHLTELGIAARPEEIVTSSHAAAAYLLERLGVGARVLVVGTTGLVEALTERDLVPVHSADDEPVAVVQGYSPTLDWRQLAEGAVAINRGALWVATNLDPTVPSPRGPLPGNGSLVAALRHATGTAPIATGKPDPTMHRESVRRTGARHPLVVGDRLDTDIEGANAAGCDSLLVLTGVTAPRDLVTAPGHARPTYVAYGLEGLLRPHPPTDYRDKSARCGRWTAVATDDALRLRADATGDKPSSVQDLSDDRLDALRALCGAAWAAAGRSAIDADISAVGDDACAAEALSVLGLRS